MLLHFFRKVTFVVLGFCLLSTPSESIAESAKCETVINLAEVLYSASISVTLVSGNGNNWRYCKFSINGETADSEPTKQFEGMIKKALEHSKSLREKRFASPDSFTLLPYLWLAAAPEYTDELVSRAIGVTKPYSQELAGCWNEYWSGKNPEFISKDKSVSCIWKEDDVLVTRLSLGDIDVVTFLNR